MGDFADVYVRVSENLKITYLTTKFSKTPEICWILLNKKKMSLQYN